MNYNKFEDQISDWIENSMDIKQRKEFEKFLSENPEYFSKFREYGVSKILGGPKCFC